MAETLSSLDELKGSVEGVEAAAPVVETIHREPQRDALGRAYATGKRKDAVARVWIKPGSGKITVNGKDMPVYFARPVLQMMLRQPFTVAGVDGEFDVMATVKGERCFFTLHVTQCSVAQSDFVQLPGITL